MRVDAIRRVPEAHDGVFPKPDPQLCGDTLWGLPVRRDSPSEPRVRDELRWGRRRVSAAAVGPDLTLRGAELMLVCVEVDPDVVLQSRADARLPPRLERDANPKRPAVSNSVSSGYEPVGIRKDNVPNVEGDAVRRASPIHEGRA